MTASYPFAVFGDEFKGNNELKLTSGGNSFLIDDKPIQTFATASFGLNLADAGGLSGYIRGDGLFASKYTSGAIRLGVRQQF